MRNSPFGFCQAMELKKHAWKRTITKTLLVMKLTILLMTVALLTVHAETGRAQSVTLSGKEIPLKQVFAVIKKQTGYVTLHNKELLAKAKDVSLSVKNMPLQDLLDIVFKDQPLKYVIEGKTIVVSSKSYLSTSPSILVDPIPPVADTIIIVRGRVVDANNDPVTGANVTVLRTKQGSATDKNGMFTVKARMDDLLEITFIGFEKFQHRVRSNNAPLISLKKSETSIKEVIITGMVDRKQTSFTGAAVTYTQKELLQAGNKNVLQSLKNMDPSFRVMENLSLGSDPNRLPEIQMRGQSSLPNLQGDFSGNPNQPLFILDGFETTLQRVFDLNMNRIASVTLLKDAAAKAIYGSRAANGVVVIETIRPAKGKLRISYSGDAAIEAPDLSGYNLMEAADKLAFEKERGMYSRFTFSAADVQERDAIYKTNYENVLRGVNTYWLSQPLQTGLSTKHALNLEGGDNNMRYQAGITYNKIDGVMKGSGRNTMALFTTLSYTYRNLIFRNQLEFNRNVSTNSPYGSFSEYAKLNQYYKPTDDNGNLVKVMGLYPFYNGPDRNVYNPLYNAGLNVKSESGYSQLINNFYIDWRISPAIRATGSISYSRNESSSDVFLPPSHTSFINYDANGMSDRKGTYTKGDGYNQNIISNIGINYNKMIGGHQILANATWNLNTRRDVSTTVIAEGFGNDNVDNITFATKYALNTKPTGSDSRVREIGVVGILGYSYEDRYLFDASIRSNGSSMFGVDNRWGAFWSLGVGWNLHKEPFMNNITWINQLRLRSSYGYTGAQNFNPFQGRARYTFGSIVYNNSLGAELQGLPNNSLKWQKKMDFNAGFDMMVKRFLTLRFDYSRGVTTDLLVDMTIPPSMGFNTYKENVGEILNKGYEFSVGVTPWRDDRKRAWVTFNFTGAHFENKLQKVYDIFTTWNQKQDADKNINPGGTGFNRDTYRRPAVYLIEGQSMDAIWGVRSLGIDPLTGEEMFVDKDGNNTFLWSTANQTIIGDKNPTLNGTLGLNAGYKGFSLSVACTYRYGGDLYNSTLVERVENVTGMDNLDKRILESWRKPGDIAQYRVLTLTGGTSDVNTRPTSRFVQRDNELYVSSLNLAYDFIQQRWLKKAGMDNLRLTFYMNELVRLSSIQIERGTDYPFARNFSFQVQASF
ncbi:TonB-linked SusC/RagA family outer membrane protein [Pseudobacter ginsenosidimutans]|uniref:TonB-linked SusC/RagA family outer membrane protein n=2 Tax=Pseudobacter ginsenosidimutans TaxID=661488 RepID=A0A4Q7MVA2_9BACT|nr:TonB-linked SusC/RagA family outer membrane protein [Pseudobacter ginsenosidimutans]